MLTWHPLEYKHMTAQATHQFYCEQAYDTSGAERAVPCCPNSDIPVMDHSETSYPYRLVSFVIYSVEAAQASTTKGFGDVWKGSRMFTPALSCKRQLLRVLSVRRSARNSRSCARYGTA